MEFEGVLGIQAQNAAKRDKNYGVVLQRLNMESN